VAHERRQVRLPRARRRLLQRAHEPRVQREGNPPAPGKFIKTYLFEAFDEDWKASVAPYEAHLRVQDLGRQVKV